MGVSYPGNISDFNTLTALRSIINEVNRETDEILFTVAVAGTEVAVPHTVDRAPSSVAQVVTTSTTGQGVVYPGTTAWTNRLAYLTATEPGVYAIRVRR
jgi:hypothetical protein